MTESVPREVLHKVRKLAQLAREARQSRFAVSITRLTVLKSLSQQPEVANRFVTHLAQRTRQKLEKRGSRPGHLSKKERARHHEMIDRAVTALKKYLDKPSEYGRSRLWTIFHELAGEQNEYRRVYGGPVRVIKDRDLLLVEHALRTVLADEASTPLWAYQTARCYAERYDSSHGVGLTPASAPLLQDIADFWMQEFGLTTKSITTPPGPESRRKRCRRQGQASRRSGSRNGRGSSWRSFTCTASCTAWGLPS
jgi:hypothetical protein